MKRLVILSVFLFLISISLAYADDVTVKYSITNNQVPPGGDAAFVLTILNNQTFPEDFVMQVTDVSWNVRTNPWTDYSTGIHVPTESSYSTQLFLQSVGKVSFATHYVQVNLISKSSGKTYGVVVPIDVRQDLVKYPLDLDTQISMPSQIQPKKPFSIKLFLKNNQDSFLKNLTVALSSDLIHQSSTIELGPEEDKTVEFSLTFDEMTKPQKDTLTIQISKDGNHVATLTKDYEVVSYVPPFTQKETEKKSFLTFTTTLDVTNQGNSEETQTVKSPLRMFDSLFASTDPKAGIVQEAGQTFFGWKTTLGPQQSTSVHITRNYTSLFYAFIILVIVLTLYYTFRSPIVVKKKVRKITAHGEQITGLKVVLNVKNRSMKPVHTMRLIDKVPNLVAFVRSGMETAKPNAATPHAAGTVIAWDIAVVEPGEERVFTYELRPKLAVVGGLDLGPAIISFRKGSRHIRKKSNSLDVYV